MKIITKTIPLLSLTCSAFMGLFSFSAAAQESTDWFYCVITDDYNNAAYYTEAFVGNYDAMEDYQQKFLDMVLARYGDEVDGDPYCSFEEDKSVLIEAMTQDIADNKDFYANVVTIPLH